MDAIKRGAIFWAAALVLGLALSFGVPWLTSQGEEEPKLVIGVGEDRKSVV